VGPFLLSLGAVDEKVQDAPPPPGRPVSGAVGSHELYQRAL